MTLRQLLDVPAPAKLNLFLHIVGRRADGYHLLQSVFVLIDWCDTLHFERCSGGQISRLDLNPNLKPEHALPANDLVLRAARALQSATGCTWGAQIALDKQIPQQAGLGGGSSDAASTLLALNRLWGLGLNGADLQRIGLTLGADVPFFVGGRNAWVEGIGDMLQPIDLQPARYLVLKPPSGASTPEIFSHPALKRDTPRARIEDFVANPTVGLLVNDLQPVATELCPDIALGLRWMAEHGLEARMSGSGSAVYAPLESLIKGSSAYRAAGLPGHWVARVCSSLQEHPLFGWCKR